MDAEPPPTCPVILSICITTYNRARYIGTTLESILPQLSAQCEVLVLDAASTDDTMSVVSAYANRHSSLRYLRLDSNNGIDRDYDRAVTLARGDYCWLMTDDDLMKDGAVETVLRAVSQAVSLVIVNVDFMDFSMSRILQPGWLRFRDNRYYAPEHTGQLFVDVNDLLAYVGCIVLKRDVWLARPRARYFGTWFVYIGVAFAEPLPDGTLVLSNPLVSYRTGNTHTWSPQRGEILFEKWPALIESLPLLRDAKRRVPSAEPWRSPTRLWLLRGMALYSLAEYRQWVRPKLQSRLARVIPLVIACMPGVLVNAAFILHDSLLGRRGDRLQLMHESRFCWRNWRRRMRTSMAPGVKAQGS